MPQAYYFFLNSQIFLFKRLFVCYNIFGIIFLERKSYLNELIKLIRHRKIKALFMAKTHNTFIQFFRYIFVGILTNAIDWVALWFLYQKLNVYEYLSVALAFLLGLAANYILSTKMVFVGIAKNKKHTEKIPVYFFVAVLGLVLTEVFMLLFDGLLGIHYMVSKILTTVIVFIWNFGSKKIILYRKHD